MCGVLFGLLYWLLCTAYMRTEPQFKSLQEYYKHSKYKDQLMTVHLAHVVILSERYKTPSGQLLLLRKRTSLGSPTAKLRMQNRIIGMQGS